MIQKPRRLPGPACERWRKPPVRFENDESGLEQKWINQLIKPGSSLGGARPKATVLDTSGNLWIAKFPSKHDDVNVGAWEKVTHDLARLCGLDVPESMALRDVLKEAVNDQYDYIDWWLYEATDDYTVWEADCTMKYCLKDPEALYDYITGTLKPVPVSSGESTSQQE
ncbi:MAG: HipA domain-containing protein [Lachnospiraceae bacterium]